MSGLEHFREDESWYAARRMTFDDDAAALHSPLDIRRKSRDNRLTRVTHPCRQPRDGDAGLCASRENSLCCQKRSLVTCDFGFAA